MNKIDLNVILGYDKNIKPIHDKKDLLDMFWYNQKQIASVVIDLLRERGIDMPYLHSPSPGLNPPKIKVRKVNVKSHKVKFLLVVEKHLKGLKRNRIATFDGHLIGSLKERKLIIELDCIWFYDASDYADDVNGKTLSALKSSIRNITAK